MDKEKVMETVTATATWAAETAHKTFFSFCYLSF
jgi:hypothetical protein